MNSPLAVDDPLAEQEVTIVITLVVGEQARDERLAQVSVGVTEQPPVTRTGTFGQVAALIDKAWTAFGVQAQAAAAQDGETAGQTAEPAGETMDTAVRTTQETTPQPDLSFLF